MTVGRERYSEVAIILHWLIAIFIGLNLIIGSFMEHLSDPLRINVVRLHESFGVSVFVLTFVRVAWRLGHKPPAFAAHVTAWERGLASGVYALFYFLTVAMPITGWLLISSNLRRPMLIYWAWVLPPFSPISQLPATAGKTALHDHLVTTHTIGAWTMLALLLLHAAGALKHQFVDRDPELARMWFGRVASRR